MHAAETSRKNRQIHNYPLKFNTPLSITDSTSRQKTTKDTEHFDNTINQLDVIDTGRIRHLITAADVFSSCAHGTFTKTDHILGHKQTSKCFKEFK